MRRQRGAAQGGGYDAACSGLRGGNTLRSRETSLASGEARAVSLMCYRADTSVGGGEALPDMEVEKHALVKI